MAKKQIIKKKRSIWAPLTVTLLGATTIVSTGLAVYFALRQGKSATYTITIDTNGGDIYGGTTQQMLQGSLVGQIPTPYKGPADGKVFDHWEEVTTNEQLDPKAEINKNMKIKAFYKDAVDAVTVTLNFGTGGSLPGKTAETETLLVKYGTKVGELPTPIKTNCMFLKWTEKGFGEEIKTATILTAEYQTQKGSYVKGGNILLTPKTGVAGHDSSPWVLYDSEAHAYANPTWSISVKKKDTQEVVENVFYMEDATVKWKNTVAAGSYIGTVTGTEGDVTASYDIAIEVTDRVITIDGDSTIIINEDDEPTTHTYTFNVGGIAQTSYMSWQIRGTKPDRLTIGTGAGGVGELKWEPKGSITPGTYQFSIYAKNSMSGLDATLPITFICNERGCEIESAPTGEIKIYNDLDKVKLSTTPFKMKYNGSTVTENIEWQTDVDGLTIEQDTDENYYLYANSDSWVETGTHLVTITGTYSITQSPFSVKKTVTTTLNVIVNRHSYSLKGGTAHLGGVAGHGGTDVEKWQVYQDTSTSAYTGADSITWAVTDMLGAAIQGINISTEGFVSWDGATLTTPAEYKLIVKATIKSKVRAAQDEEATYPVILNIVEHSYVFDGGSTRLNAKANKADHDTHAWTLTEDKTTTIGYDKLTKLEVTNTTGGEITGVTKDIKADGIVRWTDAIEVGQYDLMITATYNGLSYSSYATLIVADADYTLTGGATTIATNSTKVEDGTGTTKWAMTKNTAAFTPAEYEVLNGPTGTDVYFKVATDGTVTWKNIPAGTYNMTLNAYEKTKASGGTVIASVAITLVSTETYEIKYTDGTKGSSWVVKDTDTKVFEKGFALHKNESGTAETVVSWGIKTDSITPTPASGSIAFSTEGDKNQLVATTLATGTYSMTIEATQNSKVVASMPFTVTSQDLAIDGEETLNFDNGLTANYTINTSHTVTWSISSWTPTTAGTAQPRIAAAATGNGAVVTLTNAQDPSGTLVIKATDNTYSSTQPLETTKTITINKPEVNSSKVWTYDTTNNWSYVDMTSACGTGNIDIYAPGTTTTPVASKDRTAFDQNVVVGQKVASIPNAFLNGCSAFGGGATIAEQAQLSFADNSECIIVGNDFLNGCTAFLGNSPTKSGLVLPSAVQIIGDNFLKDCTSFQNWGRPFAMPSSLTTIGDKFFWNCQSYSFGLTIASTVSSIGENFLYNCYSICSAGGSITINTNAFNFKAFAAVPLSFACDNYQKSCYSNGITIAGTVSLDDLKAIFPNITSSTTGEVCRNIHA